jgi:metal-responsive CopG/Arc/MetJ family transcriptional regulator
MEGAVMPNTRLNITLPTEIVDDIKALYGQRGLSQFLEEAAREKLAEEKNKIHKGLIEGYRSTAEETKEVLKKFEAAVTEKCDV